MFKKLSLTLFLLVLALGLICGTSQATGIYGTAVTGDDLSDYRTATDSDPNEGLTVEPGGTTYWQDMTIEWEITKDGGGADVWEYCYTFTWTSEGHDISHFTLDVTDNAILSEFWGDGAPDEFGDKDGIIGAIKFDSGGESGIEYCFFTTREPVWGDFIIKDGSANDVGDPPFDKLIAFNYGFGNIDSDDKLWYIARPDGGGTEVPEPTTMLLFGSGLVGLMLYGRKRFRKETDKTS